MSDIQKQLRHLKDQKAGTSGSNSLSMKEKLDRLYNRSASKTKYFPEEQVVRSHKRLEELVHGEYVNTYSGDIYRARTTYPLSDFHGQVQLQDLLTLDEVHLRQLGNITDNAEINFENALFIDTEASGLSGGAGTYAFMIGIGYLNNEHFTVDQFFVDSYAKEEGMLDLVRNYCQQSSLIVTFNGKSFDLNLLKTRYQMHRQDSPFASVPHLDLLHPSRNLWNLDLDNCKLQTIEREILEFVRENDTPGADVPDIYFDFIRTGDPTEIAGIFEHNTHDIVSLVALTIMLERNFIGDRHIPGESGLTMFSRAKIYEKQDNLTKAIDCYNASLEHEVSNSRRCKILSRLALLHKRQEDWQVAVTLWREQIKTMPLFMLEPYAELAKYFEHAIKDYQKALEWVDRALLQIPDTQRQKIESLKHRRQRLQSKIKRLNNAH